MAAASGVSSSFEGVHTMPGDLGMSRKARAMGRGERQVQEQDSVVSHYDPGDPLTQSCSCLSEARPQN